MITFFTLPLPFVCDPEHCVVWRWRVGYRGLLTWGTAPWVNGPMKNDKEIALMQALVAVLAAAKDLGVGDQVVAKATAGLVCNDPRYRWLEQSHSISPIAEIEQTSGWVGRQGG
ncbi:hypothetical protein ID144_21810 [Pseudomonas sp. JM0905a]|uniref:hypothetical protein n=1 Tax=Pseudomonas sp. JM0905a TaxID=2772484 RepID=UPI0016862CD3|nr:hypothetical protein [Pseudomonas sp. JM0905a]MBD2839684.1 hypothetical protein [Pseudomonas sp. JM0905a]